MDIDGINPKVVLMYCADIFSKPIRDLFYVTFIKGYLPSGWYTHCIIPVFKCGNHTVVSPIILYYTFMNISSPPVSFGFLPGQSSLQQLLLFINKLLDTN